MSEKLEPNPDPELLIRELSGRIGKYEIVKPLGKGAMGMVYLAHDTVLERDVALKVMVANIADDPELKQRFEREAKAVAKMTHPNVVNVFDLGSHTDGSPYIAMELLKGMDLQKAIRSGPPVSLERKVATIVQVLAGLAHAHQAGIVHRDIKPANIFISTDGSVKIMDFGVARLTTASMTGTGNIVGTADYMSPEQVKGAKVDGRSDVFSVGCMLYELLAGRRPFHSENLMAIFYKITHEEPSYEAIPAGSEYEALLPILRKALAKSLDDRYQTAYEFAIDLREYLKSHAESGTGRHALEELLDLGAPPSFPPAPLTDAAAGPTLVNGEEETGLVTGVTASVGPTVRGRPAPPTRASPAAPRAGEATVSGHAATRIGAASAPPAVPARAAGGTVVRPSPPPRPVARTQPALYAVLGGLVAALVAAGGYIYWSRTQQATPSATPPATVASAAPEPPTTMARTSAAATPTPAATLPTPAVVDVGKAAAAPVRGAQAAFASQDYERAVGLAQAALREDPGSAAAQKILDNALAGQAAAARFRTAEAALERGDLTQAASEIDAARAGAPWDSRGSTLLQRLHEAQRAQQEIEAKAQQDAQQKAQQQAQQKAQKAAAQVSDMLSRADGALGEQRYDAALSLYDQVLALEPQNQRASVGRTGALSARALSQAAQGGAAKPGKVFFLGATQAQGADTSSAGGGVPGFEDSGGVTVKKGTQAANLPGKINIDVDPASVKPGERYTVRISVRNEGDAPIQVQEMIVKTTVNGRTFRGPVPPLVRDVAPQQKAMLREISEVWKEDTTSWRMEVTVRTARGETYSNDVTWK